MFQGIDRKIVWIRRAIIFQMREEIEIQVLGFFAIGLELYSKGHKMSNDSQIRCDKLACTINTADNGNSLL